MYALDTTCASCEVNAITSSWWAQLLSVMRPKPISRKKSETAFSALSSSQYSGQRIMDAPANRSPNEFSNPLRSVPAIGCPPI